MPTTSGNSEQKLLGHLNETEIAPEVIETFLAKLAGFWHFESLAKLESWPAWSRQWERRLGIELKQALLNSSFLRRSQRSALQSRPQISYALKHLSVVQIQRIIFFLHWCTTFFWGGVKKFFLYHKALTCSPRHGIHIFSCVHVVMHITVTAGMTSIYTLTALSTFRWMVVTRSGQVFSNSYSITGVMLVTIWLLSLALAVPPLLGWAYYAPETSGLR